MGMGLTVIDPIIAKDPLLPILENRSKRQVKEREHAKPQEPREEEVVKDVGDVVVLLLPQDAEVHTICTPFDEATDHRLDDHVEKYP